MTEAGSSRDAATSGAQGVLGARLAAQLLSEPPDATVLETVRHVLAVQAQDARGARLAVRARSLGTHSADVDCALTVERSVVITWANRGTLHLVAAEDEPWLHALTTPQLRTTVARRLHDEGLGPSRADRAVHVVEEALAGGPMVRGDLRALLRRADLAVTSQGLAHVLFRATIDGTVVRGPIIAGEHAFVLRHDWLGDRPEVDRDRALGELAHRYLIAHAPADARDLARWAQVSLRDARAGLSAIAPSLDEQPDGLVRLRGERRAPPTPPRLLGPFDPLLLGWRSRELVLLGAEGVVTSNGIFRAIALVNGLAAGTWALHDDRVVLKLRDPPDPPTAAALHAETTAVEAFLGPR